MKEEPKQFTEIEIEQLKAFIMSFIKETPIEVQRRKADEVAIAASLLELIESKQPHDLQKLNDMLSVFPLRFIYKFIRQ